VQDASPMRVHSSKRNSRLEINAQPRGCITGRNVLPPTVKRSTPRRSASPISPGM
jgi:hypothetical protein